MRSTSNWINPFNQCPNELGSQTFSNYHSNSKQNEELSYFEATFNQIHPKVSSEFNDSFEEIKVKNPFNIRFTFHSKKINQKDEKKVPDNQWQKLINDRKEQKDFHYFPQNQTIESSSIENDKKLRQQHQSYLIENNHFSQSKVKQSAGSYRIEGHISQFQDSLSPLKIIQETNERVSSLNPYYQQLQEKNREIKLLKLQLERYKRCEHLNKENQEIYKRLVDKMKSEFSQKNYYPKDKSDIRVLPISETTMLVDPELINLKAKTVKTEYYDDDIKTPFNIQKGIQSRYVIDQHRDQQKEKKNDITLNKKKSEESNTLTFNENKQKIHHKEKFHSKRIPTKTNKLKSFEIQQSSKTLQNKSFSHKLTQINQKLWDKRTEKISSLIQNRKIRSNSYMDLSLDPVESAKHLILFHI